jgi:regulator of protease activity HflC (stomatin/prohibitin superfamily)
MKNFFLMLIVLSALFLTACTRVPAGEVGVRFNLYGSEKGVQATVVGPGKYYLTPNEEIYTFPTFTQTYVWEGSETIQFQDKDSLQITTDVGITYRVDEKRVADIFAKYRKGIDEITSKFLRNMVRDSMVKRAGGLGVEVLAGPGKAAFMDSVMADVQKEAARDGIIVEKLYLTGSMNLPPQVRDAINLKIKATQIAQQRENEVAAAEAEAKTAVAVADGKAKARVLEATAEAESIRVTGAALRENPKLVELRWVEKWDGKQPQTVLGGNTQTLISLP